MLWPRKFFYSFRTCRACRGRQPLSQTHHVSSLGFSFTWDHMLILLCLCLSPCITVFAHNFRLVTTWTTSWKNQVSRKLLLKQTTSNQSGMSCSLTQCGRVLCAHAISRDTPTPYICSTQITLRAHQGISASPWPAQGPHGKQQSRQSRPDSVFVGAIPIKSWSVPQQWINSEALAKKWINWYKAWSLWDSETGTR